MADEAPRYADAGLQTRIKRAAEELATLIERYQPPPSIDPFALGASFEDLLGEPST